LMMFHPPQKRKNNKKPTREKKTPPFSHRPIRGATADDPAALLPESKICIECETLDSLLLGLQPLMAEPPGLGPREWFRLDSAVHCDAAARISKDGVVGKGVEDRD